MRAAWLCAFLLVLTGCGASDAGRFDVSGTVTYAGQPVTTGMVYFDPDYSKGSDGVQGYAEIVNGRFSTRESGRGLGGGKYVVRIRGYGSAAPGMMPAPLFDEHVTAAEVAQASESLAFEVPRTAKNGGAKVAVEIP
jgi:hypothetical protein